MSTSWVWLPFPRDWPPFVAAMEPHGLAFRPGGSLDFAHASRVLLLVHAASGVDVSFGALPFEEELILAARTSAESGLDLALPRPEDLVVLKAVAARPRDLADIGGLLLHNPAIDRLRARALAEALESPELVRTLDGLFVRVPPRR